MNTTEQQTIRSTHHYQSSTSMSMAKKKQATIPIHVDDGTSYDINISSHDTARQIITEICKFKRICEPDNDIDEMDLILVGEIRENGIIRQKLYMPDALITSSDSSNDDNDENILKLSIIGCVKQLKQYQVRIDKMKLFHEMMDRFSNDIFNFSKKRFVHFPSFSLKKQNTLYLVSEYNLP